MIVCSCRAIRDSDIRAAIAWMRAADPHTLITPGKVYRALGTAPECGGCIRNFVETMRTSDQMRVPDDAPGDVPFLRLRPVEE